MASLTIKQRQLEEDIKKKIVDAHRRGACDKNGKPWAPRVWGTGHLSFAMIPVGREKLNVWPRDERGNLIGD
jgi:hypothetical protein